VLLDGKILDGVNRYEAAKVAGAKFKVRQFDPARDGKDPAAFVKSRNERPRHLTPQQKRKLLDASIKTAPGKSDREHAVAAGAHHNASSKETVGVDGKVRTMPRKRLTRHKPLAAGNRDPLEAYKTKVRDLVAKYLDDFTLCQLDPKLAELVDAAYQAAN
jgi:hypothetical protein